MGVPKLLPTRSESTGAPFLACLIQHAEIYSTMLYGRVRKISNDIDISVVLVHGIGDQQELEALTEAVDAIGKWLDVISGVLASESRSVVTVKPDELAERSGWSPRHAILDIETCEGLEHIPDRWLIAEAWWAKSFPEPTKDELLSWLIQVAPSLLVRHLSNREDQVSEDPEDIFWLEKWLLIPVVYAFALPISMLVIIVIALLYAISAIPIRGIDEIALRTQRALSARLGDSFVFVSSKAREALIKKKVRRTIDWARELCPNVVLISHSQGAAVTFEILHEDLEKNAADAKTGDAKSAVESQEQENSLTFISFGQGISKLTSIRKQLNKGRASLGVVPVLAFAIMAAWFGAAIQVNVDEFWGSLSFKTPAFLAIFHPVLLLSAIYVFMMKVAAAESRAKSGWSRTLFTLVALVIIGGLLYVLYQLPTDLGVFYGIGIVLLILLAALGLIAAEKFSKNLGAIKDVSSAYRWFDVYSAMDPVSNGPVLTVKERDGLKQKIDKDKTWGLESTKINNRRSTLTDHTTYWRNIEDFVSIVMQAIATAKTNDDNRKVSIGIVESGNKNCRPRNQRLRRLAKWRWCLIGSWVAVVVAHPTNSVKGWIHWGDWTEEIGLSTEFLSILLIGFLLSGLYIIIAASWEIWNDKEVFSAAAKQRTKSSDDKSDDVRGARWTANLTEYGTALMFLALGLWSLKSQLPNSCFSSLGPTLQTILASMSITL